MNSASEEYEDSTVGWAMLEQQIWDARDFVTPAEDLRPRVLEEAREQHAQAQGLRRLSRFAIACVIVWFACLPVGNFLSAVQPWLVAPASGELAKTALELDAIHGYGPDWGLVDAVRQSRSFSLPSQATASFGR
ncbi:hypothetical protein [Aureliella helgolandensis]|uniref:Uncharacterized protein n=1 Tax=Aureliella helgolandensis TaxID=2527968 RepID=A0A518GAR5_9BACT|nr:hypothetical protein [Aureliella helgolandensis]QDV25637.1 hypothetical protein Q31a_39630 [Aureliella helgolandensis]